MSENNNAASEAVPAASHSFPPPLPPAPPQKPPETSGLAIASLILGIISVLGGCIAVVPMVLSIVFGHVALRECQPHGTMYGRNFAIAGLVMGWASVLPWLIIVGLMASLGMLWSLVSWFLP